MATLTISVSESTKSFLEEQSLKEGFPSINDYLNSVLREVERREAKRDLEAKLIEGLNSGLATEMTREDWDRLERRVWERHQASLPT